MVTLGIVTITLCLIFITVLYNYFQKEIRGALGTVSQILSSLGAMIILSVGPFVSFNVINTVLTCITFGTFLPILFLPESPYFLYSKGKK